VRRSFTIHVHLFQRLVWEIHVSLWTITGKLRSPRSRCGPLLFTQTRDLLLVVARLAVGNSAGPQSVCCRTGNENRHKNNHINLGRTISKMFIWMRTVLGLKVTFSTSCTLTWTHLLGLMTRKSLFRLVVLLRNRSTRMSASLTFGVNKYANRTQVECPKLDNFNPLPPSDAILKREHLF